MKKNYTVLATKRMYDGTVIALIDRNIEFCSYVVAWNFDADTITWGQGHYFESLDDAKKYYTENYKPFFDFMKW